MATDTHERTSAATPTPDASETNPSRPREANRSVQALRYLANFERLIINLSGRFINVRADTIDLEIDHALQALGNCADVDRSYIFQFSPDGTRMTNTHEWCAPGIEATAQRLQNTPVDEYRWALRVLQQGEVLYVESVADLPADAGNVKREFQQQRIQSLLNVPLTCAGEVLGFVGFDSVRSQKSWREDHIKLLKVVGEIIAGALERERATAALTRRVKMEMLVAHISTCFINVPTVQLDREITAAIEKIGRFTEADRSYVFLFSRDGRTMSNTHEWCAPGTEAQIDRLQGFPIDEFGYAMARMMRGKVFHVPRVSELPPDATAEREEFEREGIRTLINVPIMVQGRMIGFLGFDAVHAQITWSDDDIRLLRLVAEIFSNALQRKAAEERLQVSLQDKDVLLREIHHRVKNNLQIVHSLLYLQANAVRDQVGPAALEAFQQSQGRIKSMATIHDRLYRSGDLSGIDFRDYLQALIPDLKQSYSTVNEVHIQVRPHSARLGVDLAIPCGLIVNELVANSLKHGFPKARHGMIEVGLEELLGGLLRLTVADDGIGFPRGWDWRDSHTLGLQLVADLVDQIKGEVLLDSSSGTRFEICFPAD
ncbi:MAG: GAF domain-containing protein [Chromatiaceae bacterium]